jgi:transcriptional regulator with XRE-family HTH domain
MRNPSDFPALLRKHRTQANLSQADLGERAGLQQAHIAHFEAGRRYPSLPNLCRLADALDVALDALVAAGASRRTSSR